MFQDLTRIDVQTSTPGLPFETAWEHRETVDYQGQPLYVVTRDDLIAAKEAAGRDVDLADVRQLKISDGDAPDDK